LKEGAFFTFENSGWHTRRKY